MDTDRNTRAQAALDKEAPAIKRESTVAPPRRGRSRALIAGGVVGLLVLAGIIYAIVERNGEALTPQASRTSDGTTVAKAPEPQPAEPPPSAQPSAPAPAPAASAQAMATPPAPSSSPQPTATPSAPATAQQQPPAPPPAQTAQQPAAQPMSQEPAALPNSEELFVQAGQANLRAAASLRARVVGHATRGDKLKVIGRSGKWVEVETQGRGGWISGKLLGPRAP